MKLDELIEKYIKIRDKKSQLKKAYEVEAGKLDEVLTKMEAVILRTFETTGQDSAKTTAGTAYMASRTSATVASRDDFLAWVLAEPEERAIFLENRVNKTAVEQYKAETEDLPPGVNWRSEVVINVRRPTN